MCVTPIQSCLDDFVREGLKIEKHNHILYQNLDYLLFLFFVSILYHCIPVKSVIGCAQVALSQLHIPGGGGGGAASLGGGGGRSDGGGGGAAL